MVLVISKQLLAASVGAALLFSISCSNLTGPAKRVAILPAEVLVQSPDAQSMATAVPLILQEDLTTSLKWVATAVPNEAAAYRTGAKYILRETVEENGTQIKLQAVLTEISSQKNRGVWAVNGPVSAGLVTFGNALAKKMDSFATIYSTKKDQALLAFVAAIQAQQIQQKVNMLQTALKADPAFGQAYITFAQTLLQNGVQNFGPLLKQADAHRTAFSPLDQLRFAALSKQLSHAPVAEQAKATEAILKLAPNDVPALATLASQRFLTGDVNATRTLLRKAIDLDPNNLTIHKELADVLVNTGSPKEGVAVLAQYVHDHAPDVNAKRALGELQFSVGQFADSDKTLSSLARAPSIETELATCKLLEGDTASADTIFQTYLNTRQGSNEDFKAIGNAVWMSLQGHRDQAIETLSKNHFAQPELQSLALSQIAVWKVSAKDAAGAQQAAAQAVSLAKAQVPTVFATMASLLAAGNEPVATWRQKVESSTLEASGKQFVLGYGFFLYGHYDEAAEVWRALVKQTNGADLRSKIMLDASLEAAGKAAEAKANTVALYFPTVTGADPFAAINFEQMLKVNGLHDQASGQSQTGGQLVKLAEQFGK
ncbi:MAG: tetratricopeptide repeat protein [Bryobacteraceae bacterium]